MKRIDPREVEGFDAAVAAAVAATPVLVPWTTTGPDGLPAFVWDDDNNLMMVEVPR
jgi:hypothetical protein